MRIGSVLLVLFSIFAIASHASAQVPPEDTNGELGVAFWSPEPEITLQGTAFSETLEIENQRFTEFRVRAGGRAHKFRFSYVPVSYDDTGKMINTTITFQGVTYPVTVPVNYEFKWDLYRVGYEWDFARFNYGFVGLIAELKYNKVSASIESAGIGAEAIEAKPPVPSIGGIARGYLGQYVSITGEFTMFRLDRDDLRGKVYDLDIYGQVNLVKHLAVQLGYRTIDIDYLVDDDDGVLTFKGPYFGGVVRF